MNRPSGMREECGRIVGWRPAVGIARIIEEVSDRPARADHPTVPLLLTIRPKEAPVLRRMVSEANSRRRVLGSVGGLDSGAVHPFPFGGPASVPAVGSAAARVVDRAAATAGGSVVDIDDSAASPAPGGTLTARESVLTDDVGRPESVLPRFTELRSLRRTLGATQACISAIMGVSQSNVSKIERRSAEELPLDVLRQYAQALG